MYLKIAGATRLCSCNWLHEGHRSWSIGACQTSALKTSKLHTLLLHCFLNASTVQLAYFCGTWQCQVSSTYFHIKLLSKHVPRSVKSSLIEKMITSLQQRLCHATLHTHFFFLCTSPGNSLWCTFANVLHFRVTSKRKTDATATCKII